MSQPVFVIGHCNPDTDASTSAVGYARFLNETERYDQRVIPTVPGQLTPQAKWVFRQAEAQPPIVTETFAPRVRDVACRNPEQLSVNDRLGDGIDMLIRSGHSMLPVVDEDGRLHGVFSNREDVSRFLMNLDVVPLAPGLLTWQDLVKVPGMHVCGEQCEEAAIGSLQISLAGDDEWIADSSPDDILICGHPNMLDQVPVGRRPKRIVCVSSTRPDAETVAAINRDGGYLLHFCGQVSSLLQLLTKQVPLGMLDFGTGPCVGEDDLLEDVRSLIHQSRRAIPVIGECDRVTGVVARRDLENAPRRRAILVDHFESSQAVPGLEHMEIVEVVDHHRIGNIETTSPIRVDCRPIGSSASIVALNYFESGREPDASTATLLLGGLCADTLALQGPTATHIDRTIAERLARIAGLDLDQFGVNVLKAGDDLISAQPSEIWNRDQKLFSIRNHQFAVAQLETVALQDLPQPRLDEFRVQLQRDFERNNYLSSVLVVTDVLKRDSWITAFESPGASGAITAAFGNASPVPQWIEAQDIVSRKKQIIPRLMNTFAELSP